MGQYERYRLFVRHRSSSDDLPTRWMDNVREMERRLGREGWVLVSASAFVDDGALYEVLWFQRLITLDALPPPPERPLGFGSDSIE